MLMHKHFILSALVLPRTKQSSNSTLLPGTGT